MLKELLLPLLAGVALAQTPADVSEGYDDEEAAYAAEREEWRCSQHNALNAILAFVHDRDSADAAALRVRALMATPEGKGLRPSGEVGLFLYAGYQCYGSEALMAVIRALVPEDEDKPGFRRAELIRTTMKPFIEEVMAQLDGISDALARVKDAESEAAAIALAKALPASIMDMAGRMDAAVNKALDNTRWTQNDAYIALAVRQLYPTSALDRLLHAYARAPHSPALEEAMREAWEPLEQLCGKAFEPPATAAEAAKQEALAATLHEWLHIAAGITDKASADAAADWLEKKNAEWGRSLVGLSLVGLSSYSAHKQGLCLCIIALCERLQAADSYLSNARPAYFGSTKLQGLMDAAEDEAQMMPAPKVKPLKK